jgi:hypothetical protein
MTWRPHNETSEDLKREEAAANALSDMWQADVTKLSEALYGIDWVFSRHKEVVAFGEFKYRAKKYDTLILGLGKYMKMSEIHKMTGLPVILVVLWPDGLWYWDIAKHPIDKIEMGGNSRGQNGDIEPVVHIPIKAFVQVSNG